MRTRAACSAASSCGDLYAATYAHICRQQAATSRVRERRSATHSPSGAANAAPCKTTAGARTRLRASGAATPIATTLQAVARIALARRTGAQYMFAPGGRLAASKRVRGRLRAAPGSRTASRRRLLGTRARRRHQPGDHGAHPIGLGMPLDAEHEAAIRQLD